MNYLPTKLQYQNENIQDVAAEFSRHTPYDLHLKTFQALARNFLLNLTAV